MSPEDIFISYADEDLERAKLLVEALEQKGWGVWWDRAAILPGQRFRQVIDDAIQRARCVIVLWSKHSVQSHWVADEAEVAGERNVLIPALIDDTKVPTGFRQLQVARLTGWKGDPEHRELRKLIWAVEALLGANEQKRQAPSVTVASRDKPPFPVSAVVEEEDTFLALSADPEFLLYKDHPVRTMQDAHDSTPELPGTVVVRSGTPLRLLAVVHKLDEEPTWREEWVIKALEQVFQEVSRRRLRSVGLPLLGTVHGKLARERSRGLLEAALENACPTTLERLWLYDD